MNEQDMKNLLSSYVQEEMALLHEEQMPEYDYVYSKAYSKKIKRMFWSEKYFGKNLKLGYMARRIAVAAILILCIFTADEVSARVFGIHPWEFAVSFLSGSKMDVRTYTEPDSDQTQTKNLSVKRNLPTKIPDRFSRTNYFEYDLGLCAEWDAGEESLQYVRTELSSDLTLATDGEYQSKEKISIMGYAGYYCIKDDEAWVIWDDKEYNHVVSAYHMEDPEEILIEMAESMYR